MLTTGSYEDALSCLTFDPERLEPGTYVWFVRNTSEMDLIPDIAVAWTGDDFSQLKACKEFFALFKGVFLALAEADVRGVIANAFSCYLPQVPLTLPASDAFHGCGSIREVFEAGGQDAVDRLGIGSYVRPAYGLIDFADIKPPARKGRVILSDIREIDRAIGGFSSGEVSIWTGRRGSGKSTLISQLVLEAIAQGARVCVYSGEMSDWNFKQWARLQAAGPHNVYQQEDAHSGQIRYSVIQSDAAMIDEWLRGNLFLYDKSIASANEEGSILAAFELAVLRYRCNMFVVDNLMSTRLDSNDKDFFRAQSGFVGRLVEFAKKNDVVVFIVAHPRKTDSARDLEADDIGGSGDISNRADNVFAVRRLSEADAQKYGCAAKLTILKNRAYGAYGTVSLNFETTSRRFYSTKSGDPDKKYPWEPVQTRLDELPDDPNVPF